MTTGDVVAKVNIISRYIPSSDVIFLLFVLMLCLNTFSDKMIILLQVTSSNLKLTSAIDDNSRLGDLELDRAVFAAAVVIELSHFR